MNISQLEYMTLVNRYLGHVSAGDVWLFVLCLVLLIAAACWCGAVEDLKAKLKRRGHRD